ncbi:hydantoinase/oxoprolinase family protein [Acidomonas methanolica]|uniref:hydantoinase/oxoprolinase family protein n=1 Tax=Acidomonas methanolica TaxID=437 RepID=UPI002119BB64|nr:hydantoinase/oxoprolinase family protein [Acidomonas methanolica]MCQ9154950.1 hydantoinase/oxoprolinase family protein [Acidomonas methanolica]
MTVKLAADIGGTFTDVVLEVEDRRYRVKRLTTYDAPERALLGAMEELLTQAGRTVSEIDLVVHGTTLATNALIARRGARTALLTTEGFRDVLELGDESRFDQYDLWMRKPAPLVDRTLRLTVPERVAADGTILAPLDHEAVLAAGRRFAAQGVEAVAICFLHAYANDAHERQAATWLRDVLPGVSLSLSCDVSPEMREYARFSTTVANAYVQPVMDAYLGRLSVSLRELGCVAPLFLMLSSGGVTTVETARRFPVRLVESGPAGGAIFAAHIARRLGIGRALAFDMGGTTAKICLIDDAQPHTSQSFEVGRVHRFRKGSGLPLRIPVVEMVEIGAGGGSIARHDVTGRLCVGPHSAGSEPGPACYGRGGTDPTVTDADLLLGRIDPANFAGGDMPLHASDASQAIRALAGGDDGIEIALGISEMVDETMASAARVHTMEQGMGLDGRIMIVSGGAAPLHAARVAQKLGIDRLVIPPDAGVGSAVGFLRAPISFEVQRSMAQRLSALEIGALNAMFDEMRRVAHSVVGAAAVGAPVKETRQAFARFVGQGHEIVIDLPGRPLVPGDDTLLRETFHRRYRALYGSLIPELAIEILTWKARVEAVNEAPGRPISLAAPIRPASALSYRQVMDPAAGRFVATAIHARPELSPGDGLSGPALIVERDTTTVVPCGFVCQVASDGSLILSREEGVSA